MLEGELRQEVEELRLFRDRLQERWIWVAQRGPQGEESDRRCIICSEGESAQRP